MKTTKKTYRKRWQPFTLAGRYRHDLCEPFLHHGILSTVPCRGCHGREVRN